MSIPNSILIVDDEQHIRLYIKMILTDMGVQDFREANNGIEALESYQAERPDAVLMDVNMSGMGGLETLEKLMELDPSAFVVMLTSAATREVVEECVSRGAKQYIRKDTSKEDIAKILTTAFEGFNPPTTG